MDNNDKKIDMSDYKMCREYMNSHKMTLKNYMKNKIIENPSTTADDIVVYMIGKIRKQQMRKLQIIKNKKKRSKSR